MLRALAHATVIAVAALSNHSVLAATPAHATDAGSRRLAAATRPPSRRWLVPARFYPQALCVHSGWHYRRAWSRRDKRRAGYRFGPFWFIRTWDVPDSITGGSGEGGWDAVSSTYGGGMQFMLSTWHRAGGRGYSAAAIAAASPAEQIYRSYRIVHGQDGGSWGEWPNTSRACGLR
jgi:hypothetical protein